MRLRWLGPSLIALALGALPPRTARAQPEVSSTAVLGLEAIDVPAALTDDISEQLRQRVAASRELHLVSGKDLVEVKLVFSCADEAATCMAQAGKSLDAQRIIYGSVKKQGDDFAVWLKMFDVRKAKLEFWLTEILTKKQADPAGVKAASVRWFAKLTGKPLSAGTVQVTSNVFGAKVSLDGNLVGVTSEQPLTIPDVAAGKHELTLSKAGQAPGKQQFIVAAGQTATVNVTLTPAAAADAKAVDVFQPGASAKADPATVRPIEPEKISPVAPADAGPTGGRGGYRTGFWVTLSAGVVSALAAVKFGMDVQGVNDDLDQYRRFPCTGNPNQLCDNTRTVVTPALTQGERDKVASLNDEGSRAQTLQWICIGVGSALGITSGYLFYKGYIDSDDNARREAHRGLRIFPTAGTSSGGILAEFDF